MRLPPTAKTGKEVTTVLVYSASDSKEPTVLAALSQADDESRINARGNGTLEDFIKFADLNNMALLTWSTGGAAFDPAAKDEDMEAFATAWEKGVNQFANETGIPKTDYLLYGISTGAQVADRLAFRKPDYFLAVHVHAPGVCDTPPSDASGVLWLITTGDADKGYNDTVKFYKQCRQIGYPVIFKAIMGLGHNDSKIADDLGHPLLSVCAVSA